MSELSIDAQLKLQEVRLRVLNRETVTMDEYRQLMHSLRGDRENAARAQAAASRVKRKAEKGAALPSISLDTLFPGTKASQ